MASSFAPTPQTQRALRDAFGRFPTGVTVVTVDTPSGPLGITANSFASVSLDPPLLLWWPAKASQRHDALVQAANFALHMMSDTQDAVVKAFSQQGNAFDLCDWSHSDAGVPLIDGCAARFECTTEQRIDGGDHTVLIARVTCVTMDSDATPRAFLGGRYGVFSEKG